MLSDSVYLRGSVSLVGNYLRIDYVITNETDTGIYAYVLPIDGRFNSYANDAYTCLAEDHFAIHLLLGEPPLPRGVSLSVRIQPFAVYIAANQSYESYLMLEMPLREWHAYSGRAYPDPPEETSVRQLKLMIEYVYEEETSFTEDTPHQGFFQVGGFPHHTLVFAHELAEPVNVLARTGPFDRFTN